MQNYWSTMNIERVMVIFVILGVSKAEAALTTKLRVARSLRDFRISKNPRLAAFPRSWGYVNMQVRPLTEAVCQMAT